LFPREEYRVNPGFGGKTPDFRRKEKRKNPDPQGAQEQSMDRPIREGGSTPEKGGGEIHAQYWGRPEKEEKDDEILE